MPKLKHPYLHIGRSYGGSQRWATDDTLRHVGCGAVAALDTLLYLHFHHRPSTRFNGVEEATLTREEYLSLLEKLRREYVPLLPGLGANCLVLTAGLNRYFRQNHLPFRASWQPGSGKLWPAVGRMLAEDLPVIFCVGHNFPRLWQKDAVPLYCPEGKGERLGSASGHYVVITGLERDSLTVSSWGREYRMDRGEVDTFIRRSSTALFTGAVHIRRV